MPFSGERRTVAASVSRPRGGAGAARASRHQLTSSGRAGVRPLQRLVGPGTRRRRVTNQDRKRPEQPRPKDSQQEPGSKRTPMPGRSVVMTGDRQPNRERRIACRSRGRRPITRQSPIARKTVRITDSSSPLHDSANDTAVQRRAHEGAQRPTRPSVCNGGLGSIAALTSGRRSFGFASSCARSSMQQSSSSRDHAESSSCSHRDHARDRSGPQQPNPFWTARSRRRRCVSACLPCLFFLRGAPC